MIEEQKLVMADQGALLAKAGEFKAQGWRLVQIGCTRLAEKLELNYSFDKNYEFVNVRVEVPLSGGSVPSISPVYWAAFLYENEIKDLYGLEVTGMVIDYKGNFYRTNIKVPFNPPAGGAEKKAGA
jgi:ech hydrogenase subunit D